MQEYPSFSKYAVHQRIPFGAAYLCEIEVSYYAPTKIKRNGFDAAPNIRIQLSNVILDIKS